MKFLFISLASLFVSVSAWAQQASCSVGELSLQVNVASGRASYSVTYAGQQLVKPSPVGFNSNIGDFFNDISLVSSDVTDVVVDYSLDRIKTSHVHHDARELVLHLKAGQKLFDVRFHVSANDVAFRYEIPKQGETASIRIFSEQTGFRFPDNSTTFLCPQSTSMVGWKRTKPSYEEEYVSDAPMSAKSAMGHGYTFPCLFHVGDNGWVLVSETGVDSRFCASHLSDYKGDGLYQIAYPMPEENNGNGTVEPAMSLPGVTPWRTLTLGNSLKPIVETTIANDVVKPLYSSLNTYKYGRGTWSWILWQDGSINLADQKQFVDLAAAMKFQYVLVDNWWDLNITRDSIPELVRYANQKGVDVFLWYSSSGYWNDIEQGPINCMDNSIIRKREMRWMRSLGVKGIKVDFFGGDKQETMRLYEQILSDADDNGLMVIFHGCTLPRGWERMYPNYVGSEAVLASENLIFDQHHCDREPVTTCLHPFIRNAVGCMEYGGCFLNKRMHRSNASGNFRRTTDLFQLTTTILFQNPIQNFALAPNNLDDAPAVCLDYLRSVPTTWTATSFIDGYPGKYVALARRNADKWYIAFTNGTDKPMNKSLDLSQFVTKNQVVKFYYDDEKGNPQLKELKIKDPKKVPFKLLPNGGSIVICDIQ
ncbi:MAG: glycoside hydrolase family 97 protein [Bacteroidales bacterium]|nr:glycoside hydrolase family 97 protein [Bacteroidales bacterium]